MPLGIGIFRTPHFSKARKAVKKNGLGFALILWYILPT
jgi:hypothetical protein